MINIEKFICSLLADHQVGVTVREDIHKALKDQGLEYKDGKIVPIEDKTELKESEDERIRKLLIEALKRYNKRYVSDNNRHPYFECIEVEEALAWLEKQEDKDKLIKELGEYKVKYTQEILEKHINSMSKKDDERLRKTTIAFLKDFADKGYENAVECIDWLKKQGEQKPAEWHREDEQNLNACLGYISDEFLVRWLTDIIHVKYDKPTDKVEPKFKVGDWVVSPNGVYWHIDAIQNNRYQVSASSGECAEWSLDTNLYHGFTMQNAKDGDLIYVSTEEKGIHAIFHEYKNKTIFFHCYLCRDFVQGGYMPIDRVELVYPLQKTHHKRFFEKMHEAGYEWDTETKELKRIEQNPTNEEMKEILQTEYEKGRADAIAEIQKPAEYEMPLLEKFKQAVYDCAWGKVTCKKEGETKEEYANRWAEHFLLMVRDWADDYIENREITITRRAYDKGKTDTLKKQNSAWSKEDKVMLDEIIDFFENGTVKLQHDLSLYASWLKSLRPQKQWRPSEEKFDKPQTPIKETVEVSSRMRFIDEDLKPIAEFVLGYASWNLHRDEWGEPTLEVPLFRVLDALAQRGKPYVGRQLKTL